MDCRCRGCLKREPGCHSTCKDYRVFRLIKDFEAIRRQKEKAARPIVKRCMRLQILREGRWK